MRWLRIIRVNDHVIVKKASNSTRMEHNTSSIQTTRDLTEVEEEEAEAEEVEEDTEEEAGNMNIRIIHHAETIRMKGVISRLTPDYNTYGSIPRKYLNGEI